jgi:hypothetical protein
MRRFAGSVSEEKEEEEERRCPPRLLLLFLILDALETTRSTQREWQL